MKTLDLSLIIPCFNEQKILDVSLIEIEKVLKNSRLFYEIILIDDKSKDKTAVILKKYEKRKNYSVYYHTINQGRGKTVSDGIMVARGKVVGFIDVDLEVSPLYIPYFVDKILKREADIVTGYRIYRDSIISLHRMILSRGYSILVRKLLSINLKDTETGYKFFYRKKIIPILKQTRSNHWFWDTEIISLAYKNKLKIIEIPVLFLRRLDKKSTVNVFKDTYDYLLHLYNFKKRLSKFNLQ